MIEIGTKWYLLCAFHYSSLKLGMIWCFENKCNEMKLWAVKFSFLNNTNTCEGEKKACCNKSTYTFTLWKRQMYFWYVCLCSLDLAYHPQQGPVQQCNVLYCKVFYGHNTRAAGAGPPLVHWELTNNTTWTFYLYFVIYRKHAVSKRVKYA